MERDSFLNNISMVIHGKDPFAEAFFCLDQEPEEITGLIQIGIY